MNDTNSSPLLTVETISAALDGDTFWLDPTSDAARIVQEATRRGFVSRRSHTQAQWTDAGLAKARAADDAASAHVAAVAVAAEIERHVAALEALGAKLQTYPVTGPGLFWGGVATLSAHLPQLLHDVSSATPEALRAREALRLRDAADRAEKRMHAARAEVQARRGERRKAAEAQAVTLEAEWRAALAAANNV